MGVFETYLRDQPEPTARVLRELRDIILTVAPDAQEVTNYGIVAFALVLGGKRDTQIMIAGYKHHVGFYPSPAVIEHFEKDISTYTYTGSCLHYIIITSFLSIFLLFSSFFTHLALAKLVQTSSKVKKSTKKSEDLSNVNTT